jgi:hypothetical protein
MDLQARPFSGSSAISPHQAHCNGRFHGNVTQRLLDAQMSAGAKVWIIASWYNTHGQLGPASMPQCTRIGEGVGKFAAAA